MPKSDPDFSHLSHIPREEVFERLQNALNELATYIPAAMQNPYWKTRIVNGILRKWDRWAFMNGWTEDYSFPAIEKSFESVVDEIGILAQVALLDPRLQIEVVSGPNEGFPVVAFFPIQEHQWITECIDVHAETEVLLVLSQSDIESLPREVVMKQLRHELGHVLSYLRAPEANHDCSAADEAWERGTKMEDFSR